jgi:hypothetical protein
MMPTELMFVLKRNSSPIFIMISVLWPAESAKRGSAAKSRKGTPTFVGQRNFPGFNNGLRYALGVLYRGRNELLKNRDLDRLRKRVGKGQFGSKPRSISNVGCGNKKSVLYM